MARRKTPQARESAKLNINSKYDAAGTGRRMRGWSPPSSGPNRAIEGLQNIRNRARDVSRNDWSGESAIQKWTTNLIGVGITPRFDSETVKELWEEWAKVADADNVLDFYGMQTLAVRSWLDGGECFGRLRYRRANSGLIVPMQVQLIEADYVPLLDTDQWPGMAVGNTIRSGIERNRQGAKVAYMVYKEHPGDKYSSSIDPSALIRVAASEMIHVFEPKRIGQLRGVSNLAPVLARLRGIADFDDAVLERQKLANLFTMFITRPMPTNPDMEYDPETGLPLFYDDDGMPVAALRPGMSQELMPGEDVKFANPPEAGTTFAEYMRTQHLGTAAGAGLPYEIFSGDIANVSDRTLRVIINEFRRLAEQRQWQIIIPQFCQKVVAAWADQAGAVGALNAAEVEDARDPEWSPHGWQYIHPVQDVQGKAAEVDAGFRSRSSVIAERGDDPREVDEERKEDMLRAKELGLAVIAPAAKPGAKPGAPADPAADPAADPNADPEPPDPSGPSNSLAAILGKLASLEAMVLARSGEPREQQPITINNHIPQTQVHNAVTVQPAEVTSPEVVVNNVIDAPIVNVAAPNVEVAAPNVVVNNETPPIEVNVSLPARKIEGTVERDSRGQIVRTSQIETDVDAPTQH